MVTLPCIWYSHLFLIVICTRLPIQPQYYTCIPQGTQQRVDCDCLRNIQSTRGGNMSCWMKAETLPIPPQNWNQYKGAPSHTHTFCRVQKVLKRFENMTSEVELTCVDGMGAACSCGILALPWSIPILRGLYGEQPVEKMNHHTWAYEKRRQRSDPQRIPHIGKEVEWEVYWISKYKVVLLQKEKRMWFLYLFS